MVIAINAVVFSLSAVASLGYFKYQSQLEARVEKALELSSKTDDELSSYVKAEFVPLQAQGKVGFQRVLFTGIIAFLLGILIPSVMLYRLNITIQELQRKAEKQFASWLNWWAKNYATFKTDPQIPFYNRPEFWLNVGLFTLESYGSTVKNPVLNYLAEIAPLIRTEIERDKEFKAS